MEAFFIAVLVIVLFLGLLFGVKLIVDYNPNSKIIIERLKVENERLKLENEEKRALVESLRKREDLGGSGNMYGRVNE